MMIRAGLAVPEGKYLRGDPERASRYEAAFTQAEAKRAGALAGRWIAPSKWRHGERLACERCPCPKRWTGIRLVRLPVAAVGTMACSTSMSPAPAALPRRYCAIAKAAISWHSLLRHVVPHGSPMLG